jgi:hypothetical protein
MGALKKMGTGKMRVSGYISRAGVLFYCLMTKVKHLQLQIMTARNQMRVQTSLGRTKTALMNQKRF